MSPWMGGGEMIQDVFLDHSTYALPPARFEAGTPAIGEAIGLGAACDYLTSLDMAKVGAGRWPLAAGRWPLAAGRWPLALAKAAAAAGSAVRVGRWLWG
jgi:hypothetical protein